MRLRVSRPGTFATILLLFGLTGCKLGSFINRVAPDTIRDSKSYFEELRKNQIDQLVQSFDPRADKDQLRTDLAKVIALVPRQQPISVETLGASVECKGSGLCTKHVILEYKYPNQWVLFQVTINNASGQYAVDDLTVTPESIPVESMSQFSLRGKSAAHYLILFFTLLSAGFGLYALIVCIRTPMRKRKWLWLIITMLGLGKFGIEWSTGELWYKIAHLSILPFGWGFNVDSAFMYASIPAGAILFLLFRNRLRKTDDTALPANIDLPPTTADQAESQ